MLKEIKEKIRKSLLVDENERILSLVQVIDYARYQQQLKKLVKDETAASLVAQSNTFYLLASSKSVANSPSRFLTKVVKLVFRLKSRQQRTIPRLYST